jgi:mRNA interferase MazF
MAVNQYDIVLVNLDPTIGSEIKKTRPCVVISPNEMNNFLSTIIIAPMTMTQRRYPTRVKIKHDNKTGFIALDQIRTIDRKRIIKKFNPLKPKEALKVKLVLKEMLVD